MASSSDQYPFLKNGVWFPLLFFLNKSGLPAFIALKLAMCKDTSTVQQPPLQEGVDYYIENGYWVFTQHYLLKRGWCCGNGCRHCPYGCKKGATLPEHEHTDYTDRFYR
jgi:hypothetical protein